MTCEGCHVSPTVVTVITFSYWVFAFQVAFFLIRSKRRLNPRAFTALGSLILVFAFCGLCGYLSTILPFLAEYREWMRRLLAVFAVLLVITNQAQVIAGMLEKE